MEISCQNSGQAEGYIDEFGLADHPICWINMGYASGFASYCTGRNVYFIEQQCRGKGDPECTAIGADSDTWGRELEPYLSYFQADDIKGRIDDLTMQLESKTGELSRQRKLLAKSDNRDKQLSAQLRSQSSRRMIEFASHVAHLDLPVLVTGEAGVGKEYLARYIHGISNRAGKPFVRVYCGILSDALLESELFGHARGAFLGDTRERIGLFEKMNGGTVFMDEICDVLPSTQLKILHLLQEAEITRVGDSKPRQVDVRIIVASNKDMHESVREGELIGALYYRLRSAEIEIQPLRERRDDILPLARLFVHDARKRLGIRSLHLDPTCLDYLLNYNWPGNVMELDSTIERAAAFATKGCILPEHLPECIVQHRDIGTTNITNAGLTLAEIEKTHIQYVMRQVNGNKKRAAEVLGINTTTLWRKLKAMEERGQESIAWQTRQP
jgi:DNA-binding NtrC family response regulator